MGSPVHNFFKMLLLHGYFRIFYQDRSICHVVWKASGFLFSFMRVFWHSSEIPWKSLCDHRKQLFVDYVWPCGGLFHLSEWISWWENSPTEQKYSTSNQIASITVILFSCKYTHIDSDISDVWCNVCSTYYIHKNQQAPYYRNEDTHRDGCFIYFHSLFANKVIFNMISKSAYDDDNETFGQCDC